MALIALPFCTMAQVSPVEAIYAAENALYGAGYDIGVADGWIDDPLHNAIANYQSDRRGLKSTGQLDAATLSALGVGLKPDNVISGNEAPNRNAALAALGLEESAMPTPTEAADAAPEPVKAEPVSEPEPDPVPSAVIAEEPAEVREVPAVAETMHIEREAQPVNPKKPEPESEASSSDPRAALSQSPLVAVADPTEPVEPRSEPASTESETVADTETREPTTDATVEKPPGTPVETQPESEVIVDGSADNDFVIPEEPTAAGKPSPDTTETAGAVQTSHSVSSRGFFGSLFDFLFGWLI
ncbi:peptidoglycan-binding domain-containing protein [Marinobacter salicampi]|uniref:peptidoglycan-binding domain-containing protein n=1 Tax=Marinobacter salicampi TaxID=435907 RepID=UPI001408C9EC|nr:peptidoglycan-binding domain-containing protein [Marinobacter salicampi]